MRGDGRSWRIIPALAVLAALGCASVPTAGPNEAALYGELRLVPRHAAGGSGSYGDRRLRDVPRVDYSHPGFAVVHADGPVAPGGVASLRLVDGRVRPRFEPARVAVGAAGWIDVENRGGAPRVVSCPDAAIVVRLEPGENARFAVPHAGEIRLHLIGASSAEATVFAAPGPYAEVDSAGRFALSGLAPGSVALHAWHPRLPPVVRALELAPGEVRRLDVELGVGLEEAPRAAP